MWPQHLERQTFTYGYIEASLIFCNVSVDVLRIEIFKIGALFSRSGYFKWKHDILPKDLSDIKMNETV